MAQYSINDLFPLPAHVKALLSGGSGDAPPQLGALGESEAPPAPAVTEIEGLRRLAAAAGSGAAGLDDARFLCQRLRYLSAMRARAPDNHMLVYWNALFLLPPLVAAPRRAGEDEGAAQAYGSFGDGLAFVFAIALDANAAYMLASSEDALLSVVGLHMFVVRWRARFGPQGAVDPGAREFDAALAEIFAGANVRAGLEAVYAVLRASGAMAQALAFRLLRIMLDTDIDAAGVVRAAAAYDAAIRDVYAPAI